MKTGFAIVAFFVLSNTGFSQKPDTLIKKLYSLSKKTDSAGGQINNTIQQLIMKQPKLHSLLISFCWEAI